MPELPFTLRSMWLHMSFGAVQIAIPSAPLRAGPVAGCVNPASFAKGCLFFTLPFGIDAAVVILSARMGRLAWIVPLLATAGATAGAALTFWMGVKIGDTGSPCLAAAPESHSRAHSQHRRCRTWRCSI